MRDIHTEQAFEAAIEQSLISQGDFEQGNPFTFDKSRALDCPTVLRFLQTTQAKAWKQLEAIHGELTVEKVIERLCKELDTNGTLHVLRKGITDYGVKFQLAFFKPESGLNPETEALYEQNILSVVRQLKYHPKNDHCLDFCLFLNGLPIATIELKNHFTGQTAANAERQYQFDREPTAPIFKHTKRVLVHFAVDADTVSMTTKLDGRNTRFLPFNKGANSGAGNPPNPKGYRTAYLWEEVLAKESWMDILARFIHVERTPIKNDAEVRERISVIFPRYHQLDVVRKLAIDARENGAGKNYLIQHSAGSGKSNSIAWTAYRLSSLHNAKDERIFDSVIVITDRLVLDRQLQDTIYQFEHTSGVVQRIDKDSAQLAKALADGKHIVITTIQKFPYVIEKIAELPSRKYALIVDEAHSSQGGESARALRQVLTEKSFDEAEAEEVESEFEEDFEDSLRKVMLARQVVQSNLSYFAFTATPKAKTLETFGEKGRDGKPRPFHLYSMRQAIEEGFILDVLKGYITYKAFYALAKKVEDDPELNKTKATRAIGRFFSLHPYHLAQKVTIIVEHFRSVTMKKIGGKAKAMVVTSSRLHAVRYKLEFDKYIRAQGYRDLKTLVAFSGAVRDEGQEYTETGMNNFRSESELPTKFGTQEYQVLIVADKYQTGFDQPLLHTMYVDKKLSGVRAVQTLSRLNRTCAGKEDTFVLDFANEPDAILEAFQQYFEQTTLSEEIDPNLLYDQKTRLEAAQVIWLSEVDTFCRAFFKKRERLSWSDNATLNSAIDPAVDRFAALPTEEERDEFEGTLTAFIRSYSFLSQVVPFADVELEKLYTYCRFLAKKLPQEDYGKRLKLDDDVALEYYRLQKMSDGDLVLAIQGEAGIRPLSEVGISREKEEKGKLSEIIQTLNDRFGTDFTEADKLFLDQIREECLNDETLQQQALNNTEENFMLGLRDKFQDKAIDRMDSNSVMFEKIMENKAMRNVIVASMAKELYRMIRGEEMGA